MRRVSVFALAAAGQQDRKQRQRKQKEPSVHSRRYGRWSRSVCTLTIVLAAAPLAAAASPPRVVAKISTDNHPCGAAAGLGSIWVAAYDSGRLIRIDPKSNRVVQRIRVARGICPVIVAAGSVWVASDKTDVLYRVDPRRGRILARIRVSHWPAHVAVASGSVLVSSFDHGHVSQISLRTSRVTRVYKFSGNPSGLARTPGALWVAFGRTGKTLARIDLATRKITQVPIGHQGAGFLAALGDSVWATTSDGFAVRVDAKMKRVVAAFPIPGTPAGVAAAPDGTIWVAEKERDTITRIDPVNNRILDVSPAGNGALAIVVAAGDLWVTSFAGSDVWRFRGD
jgi:streptogramin lyase